MHRINSSIRLQRDSDNLYQFRVDFGPTLPGSCDSPRNVSGKYIILLVVGCFSKASHFLILLKLPNALETGNLLFSHIFQIHGIRAN